MTIRRKTLLVTGLALAALVAIAAVVSQTLVAAGFRRVEEDAARRNVQRVVEALNNDLAELQRVNVDWAWWDDTYAFVARPSQGYIRSNLVDDTFTSLQLNVMAFLDQEGQLVHGKSFDHLTGQQVRFPEGLLGDPYGPSLGPRTPDEAASGIAMLPEGPMLISAVPILTSDREGPTRGSLVMGRYLDATLVQGLARRTRLGVTIRAFDDPALPADLRSARDALAGGTGPFIRAPSEEVIAGYAVIDDIAGRPALLVRMTQPRTIHLQGSATVRYFLAALLLVGLLIGGLTLVLLERSVLVRLKRLRERVRDIGTGGDPSGRVVLEGVRDELTDLAAALNATLDALEVSQREQARGEQALELERETARRLRAVDEMKNAFLQAISHELRTPLASVLGLSVTLESEEVDLPPEDRRDLLGRLVANARKLEELLTDLLDLDRLARGVLEPKLRPVEVGPLVRRVVEEADLDDHPVSAEVEDLVLQADPPKLERIVESLVANAARHTPPGTRVWVRARTHPEGALLAVEDEGPGVPDELKEAIFQPFRHGAQSRPHSPGAGIGLALVARFAELHGGRAWVEDRPGGGARFCVLLPADRSGFPAAVPDPSSPGSASVRDAR